MAAAPRSQAERLWLLGGGLVAFALLLIGYFFFISSQRSETDSVNVSLAAARQQNAGLQQRISVLRAQSRNTSTIKTELAAAQSALPSTSGLPDFLRTLQTLGSSTLTHVSSVNVGAPTDVSAIATGAAATTTTGTTPSASPTTAATTGSAAAGTTPTTPVGPSIYGLTISAQVSGTPAALNQFLEQLQSVQPRAVLITQISEGSGTNGATGAAASSGTSLQLTMQAFVAPTSASENAGLAAASH